MVYCCLLVTWVFITNILTVYNIYFLALVFFVEVLSLNKCILTAYRLVYIHKCMNITWCQKCSHRFGAHFPPESMFFSEFISITYYINLCALVGIWVYCSKENEETGGGRVKIKRSRVIT